MNKELVLIHGWDPEMYTSKVLDTPDPSIAWRKRQELIDMLGDSYYLNYYNLPGFCGNPEPNVPFNIKDFSKNFNTWLKHQKYTPDAILGYSFGGVVSLDHKLRYKSTIPLILIAPALSRRYSVYSKIASIAKRFFTEEKSNRLKHLYQTMLSKYYREGTDFIQSSYNNIVGQDTSELINRIKNKDVLFIYGDHDESTPWEYVRKDIESKKLLHLLIINGGHNIGGTHPNEISESINNFLNSYDK